MLVKEKKVRDGIEEEEDENGRRKWLAGRSNDEEMRK